MNNVHRVKPTRTCTKVYSVYQSFRRFLKDDFNQRCGCCDDSGVKEEGNLQELKRLLTSETTWQYIENKCKYYASGYFGLGKNYLDNFGCTQHVK